MCSELVTRHHLTHEQICKLSPYQVRHHYFRERDEHGNLKFAPKQETPYEEIFRKTWRDRGCEEDEIEMRWQAYLKEQKDLEAKQPKSPTKIMPFGQRPQETDLALETMNG